MDNFVPSDLLSFDYAVDDELIDNEDEEVDSQDKGSNNKVCIVLSRLLNNCNTLRLSTIGTPLAIQSPEPLLCKNTNT
ncbi:hypothetical protein DERF_000547 [Dermatophagoides farinae]|uniref:Uncharacterized protein n=1 Tax=Dermatophagoides farinae TaxID=6954 RepID=A0A922IA43_DERFA|nr:hypothetical protein DERF_000547 [Dermatophagoides farinae]